MCTHDLSFRAIVKQMTGNCHFQSREKSLYVACACFRNGNFKLLAFCSFTFNLVGNFKIGFLVTQLKMFHFHWNFLENKLKYLHLPMSSVS